MSVTVSTVTLVKETVFSVSFPTSVQLGAFVIGPFTPLFGKDVGDLVVGEDVEEAVGEVVSASVGSEVDGVVCDSVGGKSRYFSVMQSWGIFS